MTIMKIIKRIIISLALFIPLIFQSCIDNIDSPTTYALVTIKSSSASQFYFLLDSGDKLIPVDNRAGGFQPTDGQRAIIYYSEFNPPVPATKSGKEIEIILFNIQTVLTQNVIVVDNPDTLAKYGNDEILAASANVSGGYLNFVFEALASGYVHHAVKLLDYTQLEHPQDTTILLFRHDAKEDRLANQRMRSTVCFKLNEYDPTVSGKPLKVRVLLPDAKEADLLIKSGTSEE